MMTKKRKSIAKVSEDVAVLLQKLVRLENSDDNGYCSCVTCGTTKHYKELDGGHFVSRRYTATRLMKENIWPQCKGCNGYLKGNPIPYTLFMIDTYGKEFVHELHALKNESKKYTRDELAEMAEEFKDQIRYHENRVVG